MDEGGKGWTCAHALVACRAAAAEARSVAFTSPEQTRGARYWQSRILSLVARGAPRVVVARVRVGESERVCSYSRFVPRRNQTCSNFSLTSEAVCLALESLLLHPLFLFSLRNLKQKGRNVRLTRFECKTQG